LTSETNGSASAAVTGTRFKLVFNNVPTGLNILVPLSLVPTTFVSTSAATPSPLVVKLTSSETGAFAPPATVTSPGAVSGLSQLTVTGTTATAIYDVQADNLTSLDTVAVPVTLSAGSNAITNFLTNPTMTVTTSLAPQPATAASQIPSFSSTATDIVTANTVTFQACTTNLLFPFVTNVNGFETGLAISNTSKDPFKTATQQGTCTLNFFASGVSGATNPTAVTLRTSLKAPISLTSPVRPTHLLSLRLWESTRLTLLRSKVTSSPSASSHSDMALVTSSVVCSRVCSSIPTTPRWAIWPSFSHAVTLVPPNRPLSKPI